MVLVEDDDFAWSSYEAVWDSLRIVDSIQDNNDRRQIEVQ
jgi:hypothetical protein